MRGQRVTATRALLPFRGYRDISLRGVFRVERSRRPIINRQFTIIPSSIWPVSDVHTSKRRER
jgi:hypothetical protein